MMDFFSFDRHPEFVAAFRFLLWSSFVLVAMCSIDYSNRVRSGAVDIPWRIPLASGVIVGSIALHQLYYWMHWRANAHEDVQLLAVLDSIRHVTSILLIIMTVAGFVYASDALRGRVGKLWALWAGLVCMALWTIGYGDAAWL